MRFRRRIALFVASLATIAAGTSQPAKAVILSRTATRNTSAPSGSNYNSGWQYQGNWASGFTGTPIGSHYFLTAGHVGGSVGSNIWYANQNWLTTAVYDDPNTDLRIYKISGTFPSWAPIYTGSSESGKRAMVFGRGTTRGSDVTVNGSLHGWKWGTQDKVRSWGENNVSGTLDGGSGIGQLLKFTFNKSGSSGALTNEGALSTGDSAGGVFIFDNNKWKLAGINYLVDGPFKLTSSGSTFNASLFDRGGLYTGSTFISDSSTDVPGDWYATRVSSRSSWIQSVIGTITTSAVPSSGSVSGVTSVPEPASLGILGIGAMALLRRRRRHR